MWSFILILEAFRHFQAFSTVFCVLFVNQLFENLSNLKQFTVDFLFQVKTLLLKCFQKLSVQKFYVVSLVDTASAIIAEKNWWNSICPLSSFFDIKFYLTLKLFVNFVWEYNLFLNFCCIQQNENNLYFKKLTKILKMN